MPTPNLYPYFMKSGIDPTFVTPSGGFIAATISALSLEATVAADLQASIASDPLTAQVNGDLRATVNITTITAVVDGDLRATLT